MKNDKLELRIESAMQYLESVGAVNDANRFAVESELIGIATAAWQEAMKSCSNILDEVFEK